MKRSQFSDFEGEFEIHLTIAAISDDAAMADVARFANTHDLKFVHIVLPHGDSPSQPMLSWRAQGTLDAQVISADQVAGRLREAGMGIVRTKIEAAPTNRDVPQSGPCLRPEHYFECHSKFMLDADADIKSIAEIVMAHGGHLSRNARRIRADRCEERFATLRRYDGGAERIVRDALGLQSVLATYVEVISTEIEYVVYDSNIAIDAGWLPGDVR